MRFYWTNLFANSSSTFSLVEPSIYIFNRKRDIAPISTERLLPFSNFVRTNLKIERFTFLEVLKVHDILNNNEICFLILVLTFWNILNKYHKSSTYVELEKSNNGGLLMHITFQILCSICNKKTNAQNRNKENLIQFGPLWDPLEG